MEYKKNLSKIIIEPVPLEEICFLCLTNTVTSRTKLAELVGVLELGET